jgi:hypothetical protein
MLYALVVVLMIGCAAVLMNEGVYSAAIILVCTIFGGLIAFNFFEPLAGVLERGIGFLSGYAEMVALMLLFCGSVTALRLITEHLAPTMVEMPDLVHRGGGLVLGAWTGWIIAGMFICALQTLPLHQNFLGYNCRDTAKGNAWDADRYWLAFVQRCSEKLFDHNPQPRSFDPKSTFSLRYHSYRRVGDEGTVRRAAAGGEPEGQETRRARMPSSGRRRS